MTGLQNTVCSLSFLHEQAVDSKRSLSEQERELLTTIRQALQQADAILMLLGGKAGRLGECVVGTALLDGILLTLSMIGKAGTPLTLLVDEGAAALFDQQVYQEQCWPSITVLPSSLEQAAVLVRQVQAKHILVLDLHGAHDAMPFVQYEQIEERAEPKTITTLGHLFRVGVRSYALRGPVRRYADFCEALFSLPAWTLNGQYVQPRILLSSAEEARYPLLARTFDLDAQALQITCFFQSVVPAKCYCRWDEVLMLLCEYFAQHFPGKKLDFVLACGPDATVPEGIRKKDLETDFQDFTGVEQNARVLVYFTPSLRDLAILTRHAACVLSNDTGPGHIAGALAVPTITPYLPGNIYSKQVWASSLWHHGVTLEPNPFSFREIEAAILWDRTGIIDSIPPATLLDAILHSLPDEFQPHTSS